MDRFYIDDSVNTDNPLLAVYGHDTVGIVDNEAGGIILYCHMANAEMIIESIIAYHS